MTLFAFESGVGLSRYLPENWLGLLTFFGYLLVLLEQVYYVALNERESEKIIRPWPWFGLVIGMVFPLISPSVHPVTPFSLVDHYFGLEFRGIWINGLLGLCVGSLVGLVISLGWRPESARAMIAQLGLVGVFLGDRSVLSVGLTTVFVGLICVYVFKRIGRSQTVTPAWSVWLATIVELLVWRWFPGMRFWPGRDASGAVLAAAFGLCYVVARLIPRVGRHQAQPDIHPQERSLS